MADFCLFGIKLTTWKRAHANPGRFAMLLLFLAMALGASAQTVTWTDTFVGGQAPTAAQCANWTDFLNEIGDKSFASVTVKGTFDSEGISITDPLAATRLAALLSSGTPGVVTVGDVSWAVTICGSGACNTSSIALSVNGNTQECDCADKYALRPHSKNPNWGGINTGSCNGPSQTMSLEFSSGISVTASGPTSFCEGGSVILTASAAICSPPYAYSWSNGATTQSITVTEPGNYSVAVMGSSGCGGASAAVNVTVTNISVDAGEDVNLLCEEPVQLMARANSGGPGTSVNRFCVYDAPGGAGNCTFARDLCVEGSNKIVNSSFDQVVSISDPVEIRFLLYYSSFSLISNFEFRLNGENIGAFTETVATGTCDTRSVGQYPRTITFSPAQFGQYWNDAGGNTLSAKIVADDNGVYVAGIAIEVVSSNEFYSWSPAMGLTDASIQNPLANPAVSTTYTVTYTNAQGCTATDQVVVNANCTTGPIAVCKAVSVSVDNNCGAVVEAAAFDDGSTSSSGGALTYSVSPAGPYSVGTTEVILTVTDSNGKTSTCNTTVSVKDTILPTIIAPDDLIVSNDPGVCSATIAMGLPETADNCGIESIEKDHTDDIYPLGETIVTWTVTDIHGNKQTATQKVMVTNADPIINSVLASESNVGINSPVTLTTNYTDNNVNRAVIDWGDLSAAETVTDPGNVFDVEHAYSRAGSYAVTVTLTDACGGTASYVYESIVVSEKQGGGYVRGDGWFDSRPGYYVKNKRASGKAQFHFEAKSKTGGEAPHGSISFKFKDCGLEFRSTELNSLYVDDDEAVLTGTGKFNGYRGYRILIAMVDDDKKDRDDKHDHKYSKDSKHNDHDKHGSKKEDRIRVKIWDPNGSVVYDTQLGWPDDATAKTKLGGGSIEIKEYKSGFNHHFDNIAASSFEEEAVSASVYPNPFTEWIAVRFESSSAENVIVQLMDLAGQVIFNEVYPASEDGSYSVDVPENEKERGGIFILKVKQGGRIETLRLIRD